MEAARDRLRRIAAVVALILIGSGGGDEPDQFPEGRTAQGRLFTVEMNDGRPAHVGTWIETTCERGGAGFVRWWSFDGKTTRFHFEDGKVTGTMRYAETLRSGADSYGCESPAVTFSAG